MPSPDLSALIRWPNVPACYGWLSLDRRGRWRLQGEPVTHPGFIEFINRQYGCDETGNWFLQNGPQRVFVQLEYTPWIIHRSNAKGLRTHTGDEVSGLKAVLMDEDGALLVSFTDGLGLLDDRDLAASLAEIQDGTGRSAADDAILAFLEHAEGNLFWRGIPIEKTKRADLAVRFNFKTDPKPLN